MIGDITHVVSMSRQPVYKRRVVLSSTARSSGFPSQHGVPYRHMIRVLKAVKAIDMEFDYFEECY